MIVRAHDTKLTFKFLSIRGGGDGGGDASSSLEDSLFERGILDVEVRTACICCPRSCAVLPNGATGAGDTRF